EEGRYVMRKIRDLTASGRYKLNDVAVFYRTNAQSRVLEEELRTHALPYRIIGAVKFYERKEIKDVICYMRLILNAADDVAFYRVVNTPARGIGKTTVEQIQQYQIEHRLTALEAAVQVAQQR